MAQSVKLKDGSYIDTEGIYDVTQGKTQKDVNSTQASSITSLQNIVNTFIGGNLTGMRIYKWDGYIQFVIKLTDGEYYIHFYTGTKKIQLIYYNYSTKTNTTLWNFT